MDAYKKWGLLRSSRLNLTIESIDYLQQPFMVLAMSATILSTSTLHHCFQSREGVELDNASLLFTYTFNPPQYIRKAQRLLLLVRTLR